MLMVHRHRRSSRWKRQCRATALGPANPEMVCRDLLCKGDYRPRGWAREAAVRTHARAVVIGGGVVGVSTLYHLAMKGWSDVVLCERTELTAGSTWHAAGLLPLFNMSYGVGQLHKYSVDLYKGPARGNRPGRQLARDGQICGWPPTKSAWTSTASIAVRPTRSACRSRIVSPARNRGALAALQYRGPWSARSTIPTTAIIAPADVTQAMATGARNMGAEIYRDTPVGSLERKSNGEWLVGTSRGDHRLRARGRARPGITAGTPRKCSGSTSRRSRWSTSTSSPTRCPNSSNGIAHGLPENGRVLRESDASYYLREERQGYILGPYEKRRGRPGSGTAFPDSFERDLFPGDLDRLMPHLGGSDRPGAQLRAGGHQGRRQRPDRLYAGR